jgi:hypothetical protein
MKPFSPDDALANKAGFIPDFVIRAFNNLLAKNYNGGSITIKQDVIIEEIITLAAESVIKVTRQRIYDNKWLDIEQIYKESGWDVEYNRPSIGESFDTYFTFSRSKK